MTTAERPTLFHESDSFSFAEGYCNRRINITMLYGLRHRVEQR